MEDGKDTKTFSIYKITNTENDKCYIGQTIQPLFNRFRAHCYKNSQCIKLGNAIQKYGKDKFKIELLEIVDNQEEANNSEIYYISLFDSIENGYNIVRGGARLNKDHIRRFTKDIERQITNEYINGKSTIMLERKYNCAHSCIMDIIKRNGAKLRSSKEAATLKATWFIPSEETRKKYGHRKILVAPNTEREIIEKYNNGFSSREIAKIYNYHYTIIRRVLKTNNVKMKTGRLPVRK